MDAQEGVTGPVGGARLAVAGMQWAVVVVSSQVGAGMRLLVGERQREVVGGRMTLAVGS